MARLFNISMLVLVVINGTILAIARAALIPASFDFSELPPAPDECWKVADKIDQMSVSCGATLERLMASKTLPVAQDAGCCGEIVQKITKSCWDALMEWFEALPDEPRFSGYVNNLHPWAENTWSTCLNLTKSG